MCSFLSAPGHHIPVAFCNGHHIPVAFCNLLRCLSTTTDSFMFLSHITLDSTTTTGFYMPATAFSALPRTTSCFNFFSFAASLLVWNGMLSCAVYALRARRSLLPGANINCRNSIYDNVSLPNVGVFDYLKSVPLEHRVLFARQRGVINFLGPSIPACGVVCASSATWLFPFACEAFMLSNYGTLSIT